jgi:hypothetical protein
VGGEAKGPGKGPKRGYSWEPFQAGNTAAVVHGADSVRRVVPLAEQIVERFLGGGECPDYLRTMPQFLPAVESWARIEARTVLLSDWLAGMTPEEMTLPRKAGGSSPVEIWLAAERAASRARERLGLDPASFAKIAKDLGIANRASEDAVTRLAETGRAIRERREAELRLVEGGTNDGSA